ncbi:Polyphosphate kinase [Anaerococcus prevotii]|uniref:Polyphosphate kinase n=1 Tax=Anaerococcus prevotii (strain ATCC 9321 / DSM 20548 / JCM 6508 / NCTC 11806 / PC1) TaxID=525919 RepID=C7RGD0_ANAPD|nr:RNA degradosome polyphosphate kinase [Anaerococcus prevotii]ACV28541.1 Polyphosphate kinase [Anaerococcus prevotii DSM 20548]SUU94100.1 Polyphosphate kinase [Anaerococcus prevotii]
MKDVSFTQNRELSWLKFNDRVLEEAADKSVPLLERLKFLSIFDTNLEEFFMVRIGSLTDLSGLSKQAIDSKSGLSPKEQIDKVLEILPKSYAKKDEVYFDILEDLKREGVRISKISELNEKDLISCKNYFDSKIEPILNFQLIDRTHPFPRLANLSIVIIFDLIASDKKRKDKIGIIYLPDRLPRYLKLSDNHFVLLEDIIENFAGELFYKYKIEKSYALSLTRNADINFNDDDYEVEQDFRDYMMGKLRKRKRLQPVRVEVDRDLDDDSIKFLTKQFKLGKESIFVTKSLIQSDFIFDLISDLPEDFRKNHSYKEFSPQSSYLIDDNKSVISQIEESDKLLSYPYESMDPVIKLLDEASTDPYVISIKITLYRIAKESEIAKALIRASENGKDVIVLMELRARFDEDNNILWSSRLEKAGCNVVYGFENYKTHSKVCLITKVDANDKISYITQVATGNYNEKTAKLYTDFSFMTANADIGKDAKEIFDNILIGNLEGDYKHLMVSPKSMQEGLDMLIDEEIRVQEETGEGYIRLKMNSISDRKLIDKLSEASNKGVKIDMMVRGITCILPGIKGKTENIRIYQVVGRFLEHHRIYQFGKGRRIKLYISSADFMTRNIRNRMEVAVPINDSTIKERILNFLDIMFADDVKIRQLGPDGNYYKLENKKNLIAQDKLIEIAIKRSEEKNKENKSSARINTLGQKKLDKATKKDKKTFGQKLADLFARIFS